MELAEIGGSMCYSQRRFEAVGETANAQCSDNLQCSEHCLIKFI